MRQLLTPGKMERNSPPGPTGSAVDSVLQVEGDREASRALFAAGSRHESKMRELQSSKSSRLCRGAGKSWKRPFWGGTVAQTAAVTKRQVCSKDLFRLFW